MVSLAEESMDREVGGFGKVVDDCEDDGTTRNLQGVENAGIGSGIELSLCV